MMWQGLIQGHSIRVKLTAWYSLCLAATLFIFAIGARVAMQASLQEAVDHDLRIRQADVHHFLTASTTLNHEELLDELQEQVLLGLGGGQVELWDGAGRLLFRSARLQAGQLGPVVQPGKPDDPLQLASLGTGPLEHRVSSQTLAVNGNFYTVRAGQAMHEFQESLEHFDQFLWLSAPLLLTLATAGGYWLSSRALAPVDRIARDAHAISITNLSSRLQVPPAQDELQRLVVTLNEMLERIDGAVQRIVQFTGDASHELRTPLTLIHTAAEFSLRGERSHEELLDGMRRVRRESIRMSRLVDDLLLLARADGAALCPVDLADVVRSATDQIQPLADAKGIELEVRVPAGQVLVNGDEDALGRLLVILLDNAVKYTGDGGRVAVEASGELGGPRVTVTDNGMGISTEELPRIWDRFWRADKVRSRNAGGSGLGLAIARSIADRHGAQLEAHSVAGEGSRFTVQFPAWVA